MGYHVLSSVLAEHSPNLLPKSIFGLNMHWLRPMGRLFWATVIFVIGLLIVGYLCTRPKRARQATWAESVMGAVLVWVMLILGYGTIPHEWLQFAASYLNFGTDTFFLRKSQLGGAVPFDITRQVVAHVVVVMIYGFVLTTNVALFVKWQKRPVRTEEQEAAVTTSGPGSWLRRRLRRTSAYGRPVTVNE
jgi:hypothetical protein